MRLSGINAELVGFNPRASLGGRLFETESKLVSIMLGGGGEGNLVMD